MNHEQISIRRLSPDLLDDFLAFFDDEAFADNPKWGSCYCQFLYVDHSKVDWKARTASENRGAACGGISASRMQGFLAYRSGRVVGWCNAAPRDMMDAFADEPDAESNQIGEITCFVAAKPHRRSGVATALLEAAYEGLKAYRLRRRSHRKTPPPRRRTTTARSACTWRQVSKFTAETAEQFSCAAALRSSTAL